MTVTRHVVVLVYAFDRDRVLLLHRRKDPNRGLWSPPGGKLEFDETPLACCEREFLEETGLVAHNATLRVVVTELDPVRREAWLMFVFRADAAGEPSSGGPEGDAVWVALTDVSRLPIPAADPAILAAVLRPGSGVAYLSFHYHDGELVRAGPPRRDSCP
jgi:8-oxo-dGTP diphosphatase